MIDPLRYQEVARPDAPFLMWPLAPSGQALTFAETARAARRWARACRDVGAEPGARIAIVGDNSVDWVTAALGCLAGRYTCVPLNVRHPDRRLRELAEEVDVSAVVALGDWADTDFGQISVVHEPGGELGDVPPFDPDSVATIFFTSGTTGRPKAVPHTWNQHAASAAASAFNLGVVPHDDWLCTLPLFHVGGLAIVFRSLLYGTRLTLHRRFDAERVLQSIEDGATLVSLVPTMLKRLLDTDPSRLKASRLRAVLLGGGPATMGLFQSARDIDLPVFQTYGMTEAASQITTMPPGAALDRIGSAGLPIFGAEIAIRDDTGDPLPVGDVGNIWARGPMITHGYLDRPEANASAFDDGWFFTGDFGRVDEDGFLKVESRRDDLIVTGGENVYPAEVESLLAAHHAIEEVAVVGEADEEWGERVVAFVVSTADQAELERFARDVLAPFQLPREWRFIDELPRNPSGKILRRALTGDA